MNSKIENCRVGKTLDEYLKERGLYETVTVQAIINLLVELNIDHTKLAQEVSEAIEASAKGNVKMNQAN